MALAALMAKRLGSRREHDIVMRTLVDSVKRKLNHSETIVPVSPLRAHSSAIRCSAARFTSKEWRKRAIASSNVTCLTAISNLVLVVSGRKCRYKYLNHQKKRGKNHEIAIILESIHLYFIITLRPPITYSGLWDLKLCILIWLKANDCVPLGA